MPSRYHDEYPYKRVGGLLGDNHDGHISSSFWDTQTSEQIRSAGGSGLSTVQMHDINTYLDSGWDFAGESVNGTCDFWQFRHQSYPCLAVLSGMVPIEPKGAGTQENRYLITDVNELGTLWCRPLAHYRLAGEIDLSGTTWSMAVVPWFGGSLDGNHFRIRSLHIQGADCLGLFGLLGSSAEVTDLGLEDVSISGTGDHIGGLAGLSSGRIWSSYCTGAVTGDQDVGGLVGHNVGNIQSSYCVVAVSGQLNVGGLVGCNDPGFSGNIISMSYSTGTVSGEHSIGGLVGTTQGVGRGSKPILIASSFWDTQASGLIHSAGGTGLSTIQMQDIYTYFDAGWDFYDTWGIREDEYPHLQWENSACDENSEKQK